MSKKIVLLLALLLVVNTSVVMAKPVSQLEPVSSKNKDVKEVKAQGILDKDTVYYPNATVSSAIAKYKRGNYTGCLQELFSVTKKNPSNAMAYYYMAMAYTHLDMQNEAIEAYEQVISLNPNTYLLEYAQKGRDCLTGGPLCQTSEASQDSQDELDKFINAPYGETGMSPKLLNEVKQKELTKIRNTINKKEELEYDDVQRIKDFDENNDRSMGEETIKIAKVSDEEVLQAINTLKEAGLNLNVQPENQYSNYYQDPQMAEMSMLLGNGNNNNNNMMNVLPMLMNKAEKGENIDPRFVQTMMMNSMFTDFNFNNNNNNRY